MRESVKREGGAMCWHTFQKTLWQGATMPHRYQWLLHGAPVGAQAPRTSGDKKRPLWLPGSATAMPDSPKRPFTGLARRPLPRSQCRCSRLARGKRSSGEYGRWGPAGRHSAEGGNKKSMPARSRQPRKSTSLRQILPKGTQLRTTQWRKAATNHCTSCTNIPILPRKTTDYAYHP